MFRFFIISWKTIVIVSTYLYIVANSIVFVDLYLTLRNPFYPRKKRVIRYKIFLLLIMGITLGLQLWSILKNQTSINLYDVNRQSEIIDKFKNLAIFLLIITLVATFLVIIRLGKNGTSHELRILVLKRHITFLFVFIICLI